MNREEMLALKPNQSDLDLAKRLFASDDEEEVMRAVEECRKSVNWQPEELRRMELAILEVTGDRHRTLGAWAVGTQFVAKTDEELEEERLRAYALECGVCPVCGAADPFKPNRPDCSACEEEREFMTEGAYDKANS